MTQFAGTSRYLPDTGPRKSRGPAGTRRDVNTAGASREKKHCVAEPGDPAEGRRGSPTGSRGRDSGVAACDDGGRVSTDRCRTDCQMDPFGRCEHCEEERRELADLASADSAGRGDRGDRARPSLVVVTPVQQQLVPVTFDEAIGPVKKQEET